MNKLPTFCLSHVAPLVKLKKTDYLVKPQRVELSGVFKTLDVSGIYDEDDLVLSDYAMISALSKTPELYEGFDFLNILHYRRFCSALVFGRKSNSLPYARILDQEEYSIRSTEISAEVDNLISKKKALICKPVKVASLATQYCKCHVAEDFALFVLTLREVLGWSLQECRKFSTFDHFIPAPNVGVFHAPFFKKVANEVSQIAEYYYLNCYEPREGYQRRSIGFLMERYFSYRVCNEYNEKNKEKFIVGNSYIIVSDGDYKRSE